MEIKITINAPELVAAINALALAIQPKENVGTLSSNNQESVMPVETAKEDKPTISLIELRGKISEALKSKEITSEQVRNLLDEYNVNKLTELTDQDYQSFHDRLFEQ